MPSQPVFRRGHVGPWQPGDEATLEPWDRGAYPETTPLLESSIVLGTADAPLAAQPPDLMERYVEAFEKVLANRETLFTADYRPVQEWPPVPTHSRIHLASRA